MPRKATRAGEPGLCNLPPRVAASFVAEATGQEVRAERRQCGQMVTPAAAAAAGHNHHWATMPFAWNRLPVELEDASPDRAAGSTWARMARDSLPKQQCLKSPSQTKIRRENAPAGPNFSLLYSLRWCWDAKYASYKKINIGGGEIVRLI